MTGTPAERVQPTAAAKMLYFIKARDDISREELVANWFANHMPDVISSQHAAAAQGQLHATRYIATLFDEDAAWDGVAQLWWTEAPPTPREPHGTTPRDTFQQKAAPYVPWQVREYVVVEGDADLAANTVTPNTLNEPFPTTRSVGFKVTFLVALRDGADAAELFAHWLSTHADNVRSVMAEVGGRRYVINHSVDPDNAPFAGLAELWFDDVEGWQRFAEVLEPDGLEQWVDQSKLQTLTSATEMVGIP